ncbi:MAG: ABC transporter permease [Acidimicrobiales bacterium]
MVATGTPDGPEPASVDSESENAASAAPAPTRPPGGGRAPLNPVLARELRVRLANGRSWLLLTAYLLLLGTILYLVYQAQTNDSGSPFEQPDPERFASIGQAVFEWVVFFMLLLVLFLVPGFTSGAIAGERERQSLVPLQVTLLRPWQIVLGKLGASFAFLALLVVASLPMLAIAYLIGGITITRTLQGIALVLFSGVAVACLTLACSALFRRVQLATVIAYGVVLFLTVGTLLLWLGWGIADNARGDDDGGPPVELLALNPLFLAADGLRGEFELSDTDTPFNVFNEILWRSAGGPLEDGGDIFRGSGFAQFGGGFGREVFVDDGFGGGFGGPNVDPGDQPIGFDEFGNPIFAGDDDGFPFWATSAIALYVAGVLAVVLAAWRLRTPSKVER